tara:strand:- start:4665 stop:5174 length:510 start_codon:yes stop_codon:yes gene_type:complete
MRKDKIEYIDTKRLSKYPKHLVDDLYKWRRIKRDINKKLELRSELYNEIKKINDRLSTLRKQYTSKYNTLKEFSENHLPIFSVSKDKRKNSWFIGLVFRGKKKPIYLGVESKVVEYLKSKKHKVKKNYTDDDLRNHIRNEFVDSIDELVRKEEDNIWNLKLNLETLSKY